MLRPPSRAALARMLPSPKALRLFEKFFSLEASEGIDALEFHIDRPPPAIFQSALMFWDRIKRALRISLDDDVYTTVGEDIFLRVHNNSGVNLPAGSVLRINGAVGGRLGVAAFLADGSHPAESVLGVLPKALAVGANGFCQLAGTNDAMATGPAFFKSAVLLYASPSVAGAVTTTAPATPQVPVLVGVNTGPGHHTILRLAPLLNPFASVFGVFYRDDDVTRATPGAELVVFQRSIHVRGITAALPTSSLVVSRTGIYRIELIIAARAFGMEVAREMYVSCGVVGSALNRFFRLMGDAHETWTVTGLLNINAGQSFTVHVGSALSQMRPSRITRGIYAQPAVVCTLRLFQ